jgi:hypothetical protein
LPVVPFVHALFRGITASDGGSSGFASSMRGSSATGQQCERFVVPNVHGLLSILALALTSKLRQTRLVWSELLGNYRVYYLIDGFAREFRLSELADFSRNRGSCLTNVFTGTLEY